MRQFVFIVAASALLQPAFAGTALDAIKKIPADQVPRIAKIEAREGSPEPGRWYILTQDPAAENGVHEYVISGGELVASRALSQFAETLKPEETIGDAALNIDSDTAARIARDFARANNAAIGTVNYELKKTGADGEPAWTISCLDAGGKKLGAVVVDAVHGSILSHNGFRLEPEPKAAAEETPAPVVPALSTMQPDTTAPAEPAPAASPAVSGSETLAAAGSPAEEIPHRHHAHPSPSPAKPKNAVGKTMDTVGHTLHKILPF